MSDTIELSRTQTYEHAISGLLTKRVDLFNEAQRIRDRLARSKTISEPLTAFSGRSAEPQKDAATQN